MVTSCLYILKSAPLPYSHASRVRRSRKRAAGPSLSASAATGGRASQWSAVYAPNPQPYVSNCKSKHGMRPHEPDRHAHT